MSKVHMQFCPIAQFVNLFGDNWSWLILREVFGGARRFTDIRRNTGIAKNVLSERLERLVAAGILVPVDAGVRGIRYEYELTPKGESLAPLFVAIVQWGNEHVYGAGREPFVLADEQTSEELLPMRPRRRDGTEVEVREITSVPGPGAPHA